MPSTLLRQSLRDRLKMKRLLLLGPFLSLGLVLVVLWALVGWFALIYPRGLIADVQQDLSNTAANAAQETEGLLREAEGSLRTLDLMLLTRRATATGADSTVSLLADTLRESTRGLVDLTLAHTDGRIWRIPSNTGEPHADLGRQSLLAELGRPGARSVVVGAPLVLRPGGRLLLPLATRLSVEAGVANAAVAFIEMDSLQRLYRARLLRQGMAITLLRDDGLALAREPALPDLLGSNVLKGRADRPPIPATVASGQFVMGGNSLDGHERAVAFHTLQDYPLRLYVSLESRRILGGYHAQRTALLGFSLLVSAIALGLMVWLTRQQSQARLREAERDATADASPLGLFRCDLEGRVVYANETYIRLLEQDVRHLEFGWLERLPEDQREDARRSWQERLQRGEAVDVQRLLQRGDGSPMLVALRTRPMRVNERVVAHVGTLLDISAELAARTERERSQAVMSAVAHSAAVRMLALDVQEQVLFCNKTFEQHLGIAHRSWEGISARELLGPARYARVQDMIARALAGEPSQTEIRDDHGGPGDDGRHGPRYMELSYAPLHSERGEIIGAYGVARDITDIKQEQQRLLKASNTDPLTELLNRAGFAATVEEALQLARERKELVALLYLDLDRFKPVNDQFGHPVGDALLQAVAGRLRHALRPQDLVARLGGDEFAVFLHPLHKPGDAQVVADKLVHALHLPFRIGELELQIGTSVGFCVEWAEQVQINALVTQADAQLYQAKRAGRGRAQGRLCASRPVSAPPAAA